MTIDELLKNYRDVFCLNEVEKGENFERLMKNFPHKNQLGGRDLGIDIVAETFENNFIAVQCKFYSDNSTVEMSQISNFIANSARKFFVDGFEKNFAERIWISTTENYSANALEMFKNQSPEIKIINLENLRRAQVNWSMLDNSFFGDNAKIFRYLKDYQKIAVDNAEKHFQKKSPANFFKRFNFSLQIDN